MRSLLLLLVASLISLAMLLVACNGDEGAVRGTDSPDQAQESQEQSTAESSRAGARGSQAAQDSPADADEDQGAQQDEQEGTVEPTTGDPLLADAVAAYQAWADDLETMEIDFEIGFNLLGLEGQVTASAVYRAEPFAIFATIDVEGLLEAGAELADQSLDQPEGFAVIQVLVSGDRAYMSLPGLGGWVDMSGDVSGTLEGLTVLLGDPASLGDLSALRQTLGCAELLGGSVLFTRYNGENAWQIECEIEVDSISEPATQELAALGLELADSGIETMQLRAVVSRETGAPLQVESYATLMNAFAFDDDESDGDEDAPDFYVNSIGRLRSVNEPVEFPTPEPLLDSSLLDGAVGELDDGDDGDDGAMTLTSADRLLTADELLVLAWDWANAVDELQMQFTAQAVIDDEPRLASTVVRGSRSQGVFETEVVIDDASTFRLHWSRDGIWTSGEEIDGQPVWEPSNPALLGFSNLTVDEFLANPDRISLAPYRALVDLSWLTRTVEGGGRPVYELVIESGPRLPGDDFFDKIVELLKAETAELLAENVVIESVDHFASILTVFGDDGEVTSQVTTAEFYSNAGRVELVASLELTAGGPLVFSSPEN